MTTDRKMIKITMWVSRTHGSAIKTASANHKMPMSRIAGLAFDAEMVRNPTLKFDFDLPDDFIEYAYAAEAGKIMDYMKKALKSPLSLDLLYMLRHDIGVKDVGALFGGFNELIEKGFVEVAEPPKRQSFTYPDDYKCYVVKGEKKEKVSKDVRDYEKFLKLKKKFEKDGELDE